MRALSIFLPALALVFATLPAAAGNVSSSNGQIVWQSAQCPAPVAPPSLSTDPETPAKDMNARVADYNNFVQAVRAYATCVGEEAQHDANAMSQAIINSAQAAIEAQHQMVEKLGEPLHRKTASK